MKIQPENSTKRKLYRRLKIKQKTKIQSENSSEKDFTQNSIKIKWKLKRLKT